MFGGVKLPYFKLGLIYCLNRPMQLYHIKEPIFDKKKLPKEDAEVRIIQFTCFMT